MTPGRSDLAPTPRYCARRDTDNNFDISKVFLASTYKGTSTDLWMTIADIFTGPSKASQTSQALPP